MACVNHWGGLINAAKKISKAEQKNNRKREVILGKSKSKNSYSIAPDLCFSQQNGVLFTALFFLNISLCTGERSVELKKRTFHVRSQRFQIIWRCACGGNWKERQWIRKFIAGGQKFKNKKGLGDSKSSQKHACFIRIGWWSFITLDWVSKQLVKSSKMIKSMVKPVYQSRKFWIKVKNSFNFLEKEMATKWTGLTLFVRSCGCLQHYLLMGVWDQQYQ